MFSTNNILCQKNKRMICTCMDAFDFDFLLANAKDIACLLANIKDPACVHACIYMYGPHLFPVGKM